MHLEPDVRQPIHPPQPQRRGVRNALGGFVVALGVLAAKFKTLLAFAAGFKWLFVGGKLFLPFVSMFASIGFYAFLFGGWQMGIVFVAMILIHELGHFFTWRSFGVAARLPMFIPGLGAFVSAPGGGGSPAQNVAASIAGPLFGIGAAAACWAYGAITGQHFWYAAAYIGFFLNFFNLMPLPILDGGAIAGAIDARLWFLAIPLFAAWAVFAHFSGFSLIFVALLVFYAWPRLVAVWRGTIDPRSSGLTPLQRWTTATAYFALTLLAIGGAYATQHVPPPVHT